MSMQISVLCTFLFAIIITKCVLAQETVSTCNITKYVEWQNELYVGPLSVDADFWRYQTQQAAAGTLFKLTNKLALDLAVTACVNHFDLLYFYLAGRMGPIDVQHSYKTMCREECLQSDIIHEDALTFSGCSCLELSTQPDDPSYHIEGDFCLHNTARMLCDRVGYCGIWECRIDDFMCPRYEWNKKQIPYKGIGSCDRGAAGRSPSASMYSINVGIIIGSLVVIWMNIW